MTQPTTDLMDELAAEALEHESPPAEADALGRIRALCDELRSIRERVSRGEDLLAELNKRDWELRTKLIPEVMDAHSVPDITVGDLTVRVVTHYHASVPESARDEAHDWLESVGHGDIVDNTLVVAFPAGFQDEFASLEDYARKHFQMARVERRRAVPWARLTSWLKEQLTRALQPDEERLQVPLAALGATVERRAEIDGGPRRNRDTGEVRRKRRRR